VPDYVDDPAYFTSESSEPDAAVPASLPAAVPLAEHATAPAGPSVSEPAAEPVEVAKPAAEETPTATDPKAIAPPVTEKPKPQPTPTEQASVPTSYVGGDRDSPDFGSQAEAQRFFIANGGPSYDPHKLDRDNDGIACESY
jgi:hypothetical protein